MAKSKKKKKNVSGRGRVARNRVRTYAEDRERGGGGTIFNFPDEVNFFEIKKGKNLFDILAYEITAENHPIADPGEWWYQRAIHVHYNIGTDPKSYICPLKTFGHPCPICEHRAQLQKDPKVDEKVLKDLKPKEREIFNVFDRKDNEHKILYLSFHNFGKQLAEELDDFGGDMDGFADWDGEDARTLRVRFSEKKLGTNKFLEASRIDFIERSEDIPDDVLDAVIDLDTVIKEFSYEDLEKIYFELDEEGPPAKSKAAKKAAGKKASKKAAPAAKKKGKKKPSKIAVPEDQEELDALSFDELVALVGQEDLQIEDPDEWEEDDLRDAIAEEFDFTEIEEEEEEDDPEDEDEDEEEDDPEDEEEEEDDDLEDDEEDDDPEDEEEEEDDAPEDESDGECPYGHTFGADCNEHEDCDDCDSWDACQDLKDKLEASGSKKKASKTKKAAPAASKKKAAPAASKKKKVVKKKKK